MMFGVLQNFSQGGVTGMTQGARMRVVAQTLNQQQVLGIQDHVGQPRVVPRAVLGVQIASKESLLVAEYEARFCELSRHGMTIVSNEAERVRKFVIGLNFSVRSYVVRETMGLPSSPFGNRGRVEVVAPFTTMGRFIISCQQLRVGTHPEDLMVLAEVAMSQRSYSATPDRDSAPQPKGRGTGQPSRGSRTTGKGTLAPHGGGMDWLSPNHAILACYANTVTLAMSGVPRVEWTGASGSYSSKVYLLHSSLENGVPPNRNIDFFIELETNTKTISIPPYHGAPAELNELKD
ncbi:hypothetical protein MTR67_002869 [Solanum verrucosum]|uniref:Gag-pol polyprotein n=1 Tax=Solanum verrucosum TaxID=315347 RepID=A0AAF0PX05_SOLVR|nr:hypothetical protein MTR67_002869 [Solanum verrucosum]